MVPSHQQAMVNCADFRASKDCTGLDRVENDSGSTAGQLSQPDTLREEF